MTKIKLGYEIGTGNQTNISPSHMLVTGQSQKAGKTTCLESLAKRSNRKVVVFRTKVGEKSFRDGREILPFYKDRSDWQYIESLLEATINQKVSKLERAKIIQLTKLAGNNSLKGFKQKVDTRLEEKISGFEKDVLTNIQAYLEEVVPKLESMRFAKTLDLSEGINIIDLEQYARDVQVQSVIIASVLEEILYNHKDTIAIIPEAWKFSPQKTGNPCKRIIEEFIRQGATNGNFLWIDSQDMSGVDKTPLKQISEWILGLQSEKNEVKHTLDQIPLPKAKKPKEDEIMSLGTGIFIYATREETRKVFVQGYWVSDEMARDVAMGKIKVSDLPKVPANQSHKNIQETNSNQEFLGTKNKNFSELTDSEKITRLTDASSELSQRVVRLEKTVENKEESIKLVIKENYNQLSRKINEISTANKPSNFTTIDIDQIVNDVIKKIPQSGNVVLQVAPLEKIQESFLEEAKQKIIKDVESLDEFSKKILKYLELKKEPITVNEIIIKCLFLKVGGGNYQRVSDAGEKMVNLNLITKDKKILKGNLMGQIKSLVGNFNATEAQLVNLYNHITLELLK